MAQFQVNIPDDELDRMHAVFDKGTIPFERRLCWAIRRHMRQMEFEVAAAESQATLEVEQTRHNTELQARAVALQNEVSDDD